NAQREGQPPLELHRLDGVARKVPLKTATETAKNYEDYKFPKTIPYPRTDWLDELMKLPGKGAAVVLRDQPDETFYVAVVLERTEPAPSDSYYEATKMPGGFQPDPLLQNLQQQRDEQYRDMVLKQLRIAAGANAEGKFDIDAKMRKSLESHSGEPGEE